LTLGNLLVTSCCTKNFLLAMARRVSSAPFFSNRWSLSHSTYASRDSYFEGDHQANVVHGVFRPITYLFVCDLLLVICNLVLSLRF
jgi:hypothetical protein